MSAASSSAGPPLLKHDGTPRGGRLQRLAAVRYNDCDVGSVGGHRFDSELALDLVKQWSWGDPSACQAQHTAAKSFADQINLLRKLNLPESHAAKTLAVLAGLGANGKYQGNIAAELKTWLGEPQLPACVSFPINVMVQKPRSTANTIRQMQMPMMLPHLMMSHFYNTDKSAFCYKVLGAGDFSSRLHDFWSGVVDSKDPRLQFHPMCTKPNWSRWCIPIALHGDALPVIKVGKPGTRSLDCFSFQSLMAAGSTMSIKILICKIFEQSKVKPLPGIRGSMDDIWKVIVWSLTALFDGTFPGTDWRGNAWPEHSGEQALVGLPLCSRDEPYCCVLWSVKGDIDWYGKGLGFPGHQSNKNCPYCPVDKSGPRDYWPTNFARAAPWKAEVYSPSMWREHKMVNNPLFRDIPYLSVWNLEADELHVLHLGVFQSFLGCVLWLLCYLVLPGTAPHNMEIVWIELVNEYKKQGVESQFSKIELKSFTKPDKWRSEFPRLKGKGCEVKNLVAPMLAVWNKFKRRTVHDGKVKSALEAASRMIDILDIHKPDAFFSKESQGEFVELVDNFLSDYSFLGGDAEKRGDLLFPAVPKLHWMWHLACRSKHLNPRRVACWIDEDFVKYMKNRC